MNNSTARSCPYIYDFSYSITPDLAQYALSNEETQISSVATQLSESALIKTKEVLHFWGIISKQAGLVRLGGQLKELVEIQLELNGRRGVRDTDRQYLLREELCGSLKELQAIMGRQREYFTNLIVLLLTVVLLRLLHAKHGSSPEEAVLFHLLHWQLKGQHSTSHFYETLSADNLNEEAVRPFVEGQCLVQQSMSLKSLQGSVAFKRPPSMVSSFAMAFNKENQSLSQNFKTTFMAFKKRQNGANPVVNLNKTRNNAITFANCLAK